MDSVTITAKTGPGSQVTALVIQNVTNLNFDLAGENLQVFKGSSFSTYDLSDIATVTFSISGHNYTVTVSE